MLQVGDMLVNMRNKRTVIIITERTFIRENLINDKGIWWCDFYNVTDAKADGGTERFLMEYYSTEA